MENKNNKTMMTKKTYDHYSLLITRETIMMMMITSSPSSSIQEMNQIFKYPQQTKQQQ